MPRPVEPVILSACSGQTGGQLHHFVEVDMCTSRLVLVLKDTLGPPEDIGPPLLPRLPLPRGDPWLPAAYGLPQACRPVLHYSVLDRQRRLQNSGHT